MPGRVVVLGAVNVDLVMRLPALPAPGQTVLGGELGRADGGKGANQAVAAARAGAQTHLVGAVGADDGAQSVAALAAEGVHVGAVACLAGATGHAFVLVDDDGENQIAVASGANALVSADHVLAALGDLSLTAADVLVLSFEVPAAALRAAAGAAAEAGCQLVVNPAPVGPVPLIFSPVRSRRPTCTNWPACHGAGCAGLPGATAPEPGRPTRGGHGRRHARPRDGQRRVVTVGSGGALLADPARAHRCTSLATGWPCATPRALATRSQACSRRAWRPVTTWSPRAGGRSPPRRWP